MKNRDVSNWFDIQELAPNLFGIGEFGHYEEVLSFLLIGEQSAVLIDSGLGLFSMKHEVEKLTQLPCSVINTHAHFDHVGSNYEFDHVAMFDHPINRKAATDGFTESYLSKWITEQQFMGHPPHGMRQPYVILPFPFAQFFGDNEAVNDTFPNMIALHTPGHSDESVSFFDQSTGWLFAGDLLYNGPIFIEKEGGLQKYRDSIAKVNALNDVTRIFASHNEYEFSKLHLEAITKALDGISTVELEDEIVIGERLRLVPV